jgi:hypothetical protein
VNRTIDTLRTLKGFFNSCGEAATNPIITGSKHGHNHLILIDSISSCPPAFLVLFSLVDPQSKVNHVTANAMMNALHKNQDLHGISSWVILKRISSMHAIIILL